MLKSPLTRISAAAAFVGLASPVFAQDEIVITDIGLETVKAMETACADIDGPNDPKLPICAAEIKKQTIQMYNEDVAYYGAGGPGQEQDYESAQEQLGDMARECAFINMFPLLEAPVTLSNAFEIITHAERCITEKWNGDHLVENDKSYDAVRFTAVAMTINCTQTFTDPSYKSYCEAMAQSNFPIPKLNFPFMK